MRAQWDNMISYDLILVKAERDWREYHSIRHRVLWAGRGLTNYDENHADEYSQANHPLLLRLNAERSAPSGLTTSAMARARLGSWRSNLISSGMVTVACCQIASRVMHEVWAYTPYTSM